MNRYEAPTVTEIGRIVSRSEHDRGFEVQSINGWRLVISERDNGTFDASLVGPDGTSPYESRFRSSAEEAIEKACSYLRDFLRQQSAARALRLMGSLEVAS